MSNRALGIVVIGLAVCVTGCSTPEEKQQAHVVESYNPSAQSSFEDTGDAAHLARTSKPLQKVCKLAGSCDAIVIRCLIIGGKKCYYLSIPGAAEGDPMAPHLGSSFGYSVDEAAIDFMNEYRSNKARAAYHSSPSTKPDVIPCDDCGNTAKVKP